jgi:hypothetical protein
MKTLVAARGRFSSFRESSRAGAVELVSPGAWVVSDGGILRRSTAFPMVDAASQQARLERQDVTRVYERGDSLKNGMMIGSVTGAVVGIAAGVSGTDCGGFFEEVRAPARRGDREM